MLSNFRYSSLRFLDKTSLCLLMCLSFAAPAWAQTAVMPALQTAPANLLTPEFIRSCTYIAVGTLNFKKVGEQTLGDLPYPQYTRLKGTGDFVPLGFVLGDLAKWKSGEEVLIFTRYDDTQKRAVVIGKLPPTIDNIARVKALVAQTPDFEITFSTDKKEYALGEAVKVIWTFKNVSPETKSLYTGEFSTQIHLLYANKSSSSTDVAARRRPLFTQVKAGETWRYERIFEGKFPVGTLGLEWTYASSEALKRPKPVPQNIVFLWQTGTTVVDIQPLGTAQIQQLGAGIKSPHWDEQVEAAQTILLSDDPVQWKALQGFAAHPYSKLREIAAQALAKPGVFSPALKTLLYGGTKIDSRSLRGAPGDFALALAATAALEKEARDRGFKGSQTPSGAPVHYWPLGSSDPRIGNLLAERLRGADPMEGGVNNGATLLLLSGLPDRVQNSSEPLPDELKAKVLAAWSTKRAGVKNPFTKAQLEAEIALARKIRYDDFKVGPFYQTLATLMDEGQQRQFLASPAQDIWDAKLMAFPKEAAPDLLRILKWREIPDSPQSVLRFLVQSGQPEVFTFLAQIAYGQDWPQRGDTSEAIRLMGELDFARSKTHIEHFLTLPADESNPRWQSQHIGAAIALAAHGDKRGVPIIFMPDYERRFSSLDAKTVSAALTAATGKEFPNLRQWQRWWQREGQNGEWK
jgi:hypothetical protein